MAKILFHQYGTDLVTGIIDTIAKVMSGYDLEELFGGLVNNQIPILEAHPITVLTGESEKGDITSRIPAIGVVMMQEGGYQKGILSKSQQMLTLGQVSEISGEMKERWRSDGVIISNKDLKTLKDYLATLPDQQATALIDRMLITTDIKITLWAQHTAVLRIMNNIIRSAIQSLDEGFGQHYKVMEVDCVGNMYNFDFGMTLFGADWNLKFVGQTENFTIDTAMGIIKEISEGVFVNDGAEKRTVDSTPIFRVLGRDDKYK